MKILCIVADIKFNKYGGAERHFIEVLKRILPKINKAVILVGGDDSIKQEFLKWLRLELEGILV